MADDGAEVPNEETRPVPPEPGPPTPPPGEDWETRFRYLLADFENFRRRSERDREGQTRQARGAVLRDLLPLLESFRSAGAAIAKLAPSDPLRQGMDLLDREWAKFLKHQGVEPVAEVGKPFRSEEAEAVGETPVRDGCPERLGRRDRAAGVPFLRGAYEACQGDRCPCFGGGSPRVHGGTRFGDA